MTTSRHNPIHVSALSAHNRDSRTGAAFLTAAFPGALLLAIVLIDSATPNPTYRFMAPLIVAVPALAAATSGIAGAAVFTALSFGLTFLLAALNEMLYTPTFYGLLVGLVVIFAISLLPGYLHARRERKLAHVRSVAETVQRAVLVPIPERLDGLRMSSVYLAADEEARIGGDLYEALDTPYGVRMIMGDVRGKGLTSVDSATNLLGAFREVAPHAPDLPTLAARLEESVQRYNARVGLGTEEFITVTVVSIPAEPVAQVLCCGHPGPLLLHADDVVDLQARYPSPPLGLGRLNTFGHHVETVGFDVGDRLLLYTDGVTEARDGSGTFYPLVERAATWADAGPQKLIHQIRRDLTDYTGGHLHDDAALLASQRQTVGPIHAPAAGRQDV